jgi:rfaE bifunctional protein kinase chain/domain
MSEIEDMVYTDVIKQKIKTREELAKIIGKFPREKKVVMCHGVFDIVHPGHVRHLIYAKSKADILVASLTCDAHVSKAHFRPYVPEQLRAMNLAALEAVDYVIIDRNKTPLDNILYLQPDYFAKGYEYVSDGLHPKTQEELSVLEMYGGEILFTPGDIVYSSSKIIDMYPPSIAPDKLAILMAGEGIEFSDLRETVEKFSDIDVHVVGDTIIDSYVYGTMLGGMTKTPTISIKFEREVNFVGGAAIVSKHIKAAGARVRFTTILGEDPLKDFVLEDLEKSGIECDYVVEKTHPTTQKQSFISNNYKLLKVDRLDNRSITEKSLAFFESSIQKSKEDAIVFSDFRHGIFNQQTISRLVTAIPDKMLRIADSQVASRWGNILEFQDFDLITPNEQETRFALGDQDSVIRPLALKLYNKANCKNLILKLGERGIITYRSGDTDDPRAFFTVDNFVEKLVDAVGAGDALLAYATLALIGSKSIVVASILGSVAAALACENSGNIPISPRDVLKRLEELEKRIKYA